MSDVLVVAVIVAMVMCFVFNDPRGARPLFHLPVAARGERDEQETRAHHCAA